MPFWKRKSSKQENTPLTASTDDRRDSRASTAVASQAQSQSQSPPPVAPKLAKKKSRKLIKRSYSEQQQRLEEIRRAKGDQELAWTNTGALGERLGKGVSNRNNSAQHGSADYGRRNSEDTLVLYDDASPSCEKQEVSLFPQFPTDDIPPTCITSDSSRRVASLPAELWCTIATYLDPHDAGNLSLANRTLRLKLGAFHTHLAAADPDHKHHRITSFLDHDHTLPSHLFCFLCTKYHRRVKPGAEKLPKDQIIDVFTCPNATEKPPPRLRLTDKRVLPFAMVQLMMRHHLYGPGHGIDPESLSRRWVDKESGWSHTVRFVVVEYPLVDIPTARELAQDGAALSAMDTSVLMALSKSDTLAQPASRKATMAERITGESMGGVFRRKPGQKYHVLMRVQSQRFTTANLTASEERLLLYSRNDYAPYFSVCSHWNGPLMPLTKCALKHVPAPAEGVFEQLSKGPRISISKINPNQMPKMCENCRPLRRCSACPTEYLISIKMVEDKKDPVKPFKHALGVTRWSDLGDGKTPYVGMGAKEWASIVGEDKVGSYKSFDEIGRMTLASRAEVGFGNEAPNEWCAPLKYVDCGEDEDENDSYY